MCVYMYVYIQVEDLPDLFICNCRKHIHVAYIKASQTNRSNVGLN